MSLLYVHLTLIVRSEVMTPEEISSALDMSPSRSARRGDPVSQHSPQAGLRDSRDKLHSLRSTCTLDLWCALSSDGQAGLVLDNPLLVQLADAGIDLVLDIYGPETDDV